MDKIEEQEVDEQKWVKDSSVDHKGRAPLRASTGAWKAALFIIGKTSSLMKILDRNYSIRKCLSLELGSTSQTCNNW